MLPHTSHWFRCHRAPIWPLSQSKKASFASNIALSPNDPRGSNADFLLLFPFGILSQRDMIKPVQVGHFIEASSLSKYTWRNEYQMPMKLASRVDIKGNIQRQANRCTIEEQTGRWWSALATRRIIHMQAQNVKSRSNEWSKCWEKSKFTGRSLRNMRTEHKWSVEIELATMECTTERLHHRTDKKGGKW